MNHPIRVLHLEDDPRDAELVRQKLKTEGLSCEIVWVDRKEAFESALERGAFDLVLTDYSLPDYDGMSALKRVREKQPDLPVIVISGTLGEEEAVECLKAGAIDYVLKQRLQRLGAAVRAALDRNRLERETREAEIGLRESEERFRQLAENIRDVFFLVDADSNRMLYISPTYEDIWGHSRESLYANPESWTETFHRDDRASTYEKYKKEMSAGKFEYEYRIVRPDGTLRWIHARSFPIRNDAGEIYRVAGVAEDITERKRNEEALKDSEYRLDLALETSALAVWEWNLATKDVRFSRHWWPILGYKPDEIPLRIEAWENLTHPVDLVRVKSMVAACVKESVPVLDIEYRMRAKNGEWRWIRSVGRVVERDAAGRALRMTGTHGDITERKLAEDKIRRLNRVYAVLSGINSVIVRVKDRQELFQDACRIAVEHGNFGMAWISEFDPVTLDVTPVAWAGIDASEQIASSKSTARADVPRGQGVVGRAIREKKPVFCNDITAAPDVGSAKRKEAIRRGYRSLVALPLFVEENVWGTLTLYATEPDFFNEDELRLLTELAGDISFALENIGKEEKLEKLSRIRAVSSEINAAIVRIREREALLRETCRIAVEHGKFELVWTALLDQAKQQVQPVAWAGFSSETAHSVNWTSINAPGVLLGEVIRTRRRAVRNDIDAEAPVGILRQEAMKKGCRSTMCLPFVVDDNVVATIILFAAGRGFFDEDELALLSEVAADVSFALQSISRQEKLNYLAYYDALTGLANRTLLQDRLDRVVRRAKEEGTKAAVLMCDIKRFRHINETFGRQAGDALLRELGERLKQLWPESDNLGHMAADCFAGVLANIKDAAEIAHLIEKPLAAALSLPIEIDGKELRISVTAGIAVFPGDGDDADTLLKNAEAALRKAKAAGERYLFYHPQMNAAVAETLSLENKLRRALDKEQFVLHYQPKIDLASGRISGFEALIRWNDPETGLVPPMRFIPLLEETGMILEVGRWAMRKALTDYREWHKQGLQPPRIAVNVSPIQLRQKDFVDVVRNTIKGSMAGSHGLDLEITESLIMNDIEGNIEKLRMLSDMGINIAIDDFGTGYSSLGYLAKLPVNALKIDRSFIITMASNADNMSIVSTIISLAHSLSLKVIAEGVETEEQSKYLKLLKCDEIQGYLISKPLPAPELVTLLQKPALAPQASRE